MKRASLILAAAVVMAAGCSSGGTDDFSVGDSRPA